MTDRELLELAARAAGLPVEFDDGDVNGYWPCGRTPDGDVAEWWNPLTDDGDALRLAVKLKLRVTGWTMDGAHAYASCDTIESVSEPHNADPYAATRRAIVRAAAEIGRNG